VQVACNMTNNLNSTFKFDIDKVKHGGVIV